MLFRKANRIKELEAKMRFMRSELTTLRASEAEAVRENHQLKHDNYQLRVENDRLRDEVEKTVTPYMADADDDLECPRCGASLEADWDYCPGCRSFIAWGGVE